MFDPRFDPLEILLQCQQDCHQAIKNTHELALAHNRQDQAMTDLVRQHQQLIDLIKTMRRDIEQIKRTQNAAIKTERNSPGQNGTA